ncbi:MAG: hypothetical protein P0Y56_02175 [Candidatus Andeanibacterium colombiense]|uniref:Uncharacterized protein n=1 Tax=Candidatus Andeanibacterium colombiense TaxID=3121345 RepID=A0AAJ5X6Y2_9SPHN|nr:MAG: hypothetical protein P0Y56_02175 [Sphingomonadaceae bacterium]
MSGPDKGDDLIDNITADVKDMAREGLGHPGSKQVITGGLVGAAAGMVLPVVTWPLGLIAGVGFMLWHRNKK